MIEGKSPFIHNLTKASQGALDERIKKALDSGGFAVDLKQLEDEKKDYEESLLSNNSLSDEDRKTLEDHLKTINDKIDAKQKEIDAVKETQRQEQVKDAETESGGDTTKKVGDGAKKGYCVLI